MALAASTCEVVFGEFYYYWRVPSFAQYNLFGANVYMCFGYVLLDNLSDISVFRNHNVQQCKM